MAVSTVMTTLRILLQKFLFSFSMVHSSINDYSSNPSLFSSGSSFGYLIATLLYFKVSRASDRMTPGSALNRLALWIRTNTQLIEALAQTNYRTNQRMFTSRQVALIFEYLGEP